MFDARMRVDCIRLSVSMDTVSRHALIPLKMANEEDVLVDLSENGSLVVKFLFAFGD